MEHIDAIFPVLIEVETASGKIRTWKGLYSEREGILAPQDRDPGEVVTAERVCFPRGRTGQVCPTCHRFVLEQVRAYDPGTGEYQDAVICTDHPNCPGLEA